MYTLTLTPEMARDYFNYQEKLADKAIAAIKKYFVENRELIASGLLSLCGNYVPMNRK